MKKINTQNILKDLITELDTKKEKNHANFSSLLDYSLEDIQNGDVISINSDSELDETIFLFPIVWNMISIGNKVLIYLSKKNVKNYLKSFLDIKINLEERKILPKDIIKTTEELLLIYEAETFAIEDINKLIKKETPNVIVVDNLLNKKDVEELKIIAKENNLIILIPTVKLF